MYIHMSRVVINRAKKKVFVSSSKIVTLFGTKYDLYRVSDKDLEKLLVSMSSTYGFQKDAGVITEELARRKALRESAW